MKLCKDCAMYRHSLVPHRFRECDHPDATARDMVTGECFARLEREHGRCGKDGTLFLQRMTWRQRLGLYFGRAA